MAQQTSVSEFMSAPLVSILIDANLCSAVGLMREHNLSSVIVFNQGKPVGLMTERDVLCYIDKCVDSVDLSVGVSELMSTSLTTISKDDSLFAAMVLCRSQKIRHLPVLDDAGRLVGMITYSDLVEANYAEIERQAALLGTQVEGESTELVNARLLEMTLTDPLMKIGNRRAMEIDLRQTHDLAVRYRRFYALALFDLDYFKKYNDHYGHLAGDEVLKAVADCLKGGIREVDRLYRYGGEEILLLMPETSADGAKQIAQRLVESLSTMQIEHSESQLGWLTISAGISAYLGDHEARSETVLVSEADKALYRAKQNGRNRVEFY